MSKSSDVTRRTAIRVAIAGAAATAAGAARAPCQGADDTECVHGRFARLSDPEGNPIQLWQPGGKDPG